MKLLVFVIRQICRFLLGATFIFSGFVKGVDPMGGAYKLQDYFAAFGLDWLNTLAVPLAIALAAAELLIGVLLVLDELRPIAVWGVLAFMAVFTPLTLYLAIANPVSDCGCFGDAVKLSNWATFGKNIVLLGAAVVLVLGRWWRHIHWFARHRWVQYAVWGLLVVLAVSPGLYALRHLPLIDFRPYRVGANIWQNMQAPADAPKDEFATTFVYEKDGVQKNFTEADYPWDDSTWHYVSSNTILVKKGYEPPIREFSLTDSEGVDQAPAFLQRSGDKMLVVAPMLENLQEEDLQAIKNLDGWVRTTGIELVFATASLPESQGLLRARGIAMPIYTGDERVLKTVIRSNPGVLLMHDGVVTGKWRMRDLPEASYFKGDLLARQITELTSGAALFWARSILVGLVVLGLFLTYARRRGEEGKA